MPAEGILHHPRMIKESGASLMLAVIATLNGTFHLLINSNPHPLRKSKADYILEKSTLQKMASSKLRRACSFTNLLLSCLNLALFILSASSFAPTILLKMPPTSFGMALLMVSGISLVSSFVGFYSQLTYLCFLTHISLLLASLIGQVLSILALFTKEKASISLLKSPRDPKEAKLLVRLECGTLMAMCMLQLLVLMLSCAVHSCWVKDYEETGSRERGLSKEEE
ncbi:hypothetical protein E2542_SST31621 [Spatholobus suberectus]|nr:hypothetical protein E2542_SST31621 [Spatholobus suberectus]